jgi:hypothetical protein
VHSTWTVLIPAGHTQVWLDVRMVVTVVAETAGAGNATGTARAAGAAVALPDAAGAGNAAETARADGVAVAFWMAV